MKQLTVKHLSKSSNGINLKATSLLMNTLQRHTLDHAPWETAYPYKPKAAFAIAHNDDFIFLKFFVEEKEIRAVNMEANGRVWEDSCVEFFISFDEGASYYNIEINCIGTALVGYGKSKTERSLLDQELVENIATWSTMHSEKGEDTIWELMIAIPLEIFVHTRLSTLAGKTCRANFYKCGDLLAAAHFLSWSAISEENPNFHLPEFFGQITFE